MMCACQYVRSHLVVCQRGRVLDNHRPIQFVQSNRYLTMNWHIPTAQRNDSLHIHFEHFIHLQHWTCYTIRSHSIQFHCYCDYLHKINPLKFRLVNNCWSINTASHTWIILIFYIIHVMSCLVRSMIWNFHFQLWFTFLGCTISHWHELLIYMNEIVCLCIWWDFDEENRKLLPLSRCACTHFPVYWYWYYLNSSNTWACSWTNTLRFLGSFLV